MTGINFYFLRTIAVLFSFTLLPLFISCGQNGGETKTDEAAEKLHPSGVTNFEYANGIGPIKKPLFLPAVNKSLANLGLKSYDTKCASCHKLDERYIGPPLRYVTKRRSNEYILNMILNPDEMTKKHPEAKKMLMEYISPMTYQNVQMAEARNLLDYLRLMAQEGEAKKIPAAKVFRNE